MDRRGYGKTLLHLFLAVFILLLGVAGAYRLILSKPEIKRVPPKRWIPAVGVTRVRVRDLRIVVDGEGTVRPSRVVDIVPQVSGRVISLSPNLISGGRVKEGELLLKLEDRDYRLDLVREEAEVRLQESRLQQLLEESEAARKEWEMVNPGKEPPPLLLKAPDIKATRAALRAAKARVERARLDLERTEVRAPFDGVVLSEDVDRGEYVRAGEKVATIFSSREVEIEVSLSLRDAAFVKIPDFNSGKASDVEVILDTGEGLYRWKGQVSRALTVDEKTRTLPVVVTVKDPYATMPPLAVGTFVKVRIKGRVLKGVALLKEGVLRWAEEGRPFVWVVDGENRLRKRMVELVRTMDGSVVVRGLEDGERVVTSMAGIGIEGMEVKAYGEGG